MFCCKKCYYQYLPLMISGENNPNFGNRWTDKQKEHLSKVVKTYMEENGEEWRKENCGKSNRGKKRSQEFLDKWHSARKDPNYICPDFSEEHKKAIGKSSSERMNDPDFLKKQRKTREEKGQWVSLEDRKDFQIYFELANWVERMWDIVDSNELLELGIFSSFSNTKGVVRDHIYGRMSGFNNGVFPEILRHPCNCQIITHSNNIKKRHRNDTQIELEDLFLRIEKYSKDWKEQERVLELIELYRNNKRWERP